MAVAAQQTWVSGFRHSRRLPRLRIVPPARNRPSGDAVDALREAIALMAQDSYAELWANLTDHGHELFITEFVDALRSPEDPDSVVREVVDGWLLTLRFRQQPDYEASNLEAARLMKGLVEGKSPDELGARTYSSEDRS